MNYYSDAIYQIIKAQEAIIGPLAYDQAREVLGLKISNTGEVSIDGDGKAILGNLVSKYSQFFGKASVEVCKDTVRYMKSSIPKEDLPDILK